MNAWHKHLMKLRATMFNLVKFSTPADQGDSFPMVLRISQADPSKELPKDLVIAFGFHVMNCSGHPEHFL